jgi:hypothetical protein
MDNLHTSFETEAAYVARLNKKQTTKERIRLISGITALSTLALITAFPRTVQRLKDNAVCHCTSPDTIGDNLSRVLRDIALSDDAQQDLRQKEIALQQEQKNVEILRVMIVLENSLQDLQSHNPSVESSNCDEYKHADIPSRKILNVAHAINYLSAIALHSDSENPAKQYICDVCEDALNFLRQYSIHEEDKVACYKIQKGLDRIKSTATTDESAEFAATFIAQRDELCKKYQLDANTQLPEGTDSDLDESVVYAHYFKKMLRTPTKLFDEGL